MRDRIIAVVIVVTGLFLFFVSQNYYTVVDSLTTTEGARDAVREGSSFTGMDVAAGVAKWSTYARGGDGVVRNAYYCSPDGVCGGRDGADISNNVMLHSLYRRMAESDSSYHDDAVGELEFLRKVCAESAPPSCTSYYLIAMSDGGDSDAALSEAGDMFINSNYTASMQDTIKILSAVYKADPDPATLDLAEYFLGEFKKLTAGNNERIRYSGGVGLFDCAVRNSEMDVYSMSGDPALLESVKSFFDRRSVVEAVGEMDSSLQVIECAEAASKLADATGDAAYDGVSLEITRRLASSFWDADGRGLSHSNNGFASGALSKDVQGTEETLRAGSLATRFPDEVLLEVTSN